MTSVQFMFTFAPLRVRRLRFAGMLVVLAALFTATGCQPKLKQPTLLQSPYAERELWAVAPFANESGVSIVDRTRVADQVAAEVQQIHGIDVVPVNRVLSALRGLGLHAVETQLDAQVLMDALDVDALVIGTVTAWDPYRPPTLGAAIELYRRDGHRVRSIDPVQISRSPSGDPAPGELASGPTAQAAGIFDARNHRVLAWLDEYAESRSHPDSAFGQDIYLVSMDLYMQFVSYRLLHDLLDSERVRLMPMVTADDEQNLR